MESTLVESVSLRHFRNYCSLDLRLAPGLNLFIGANAQGKSNLLEAIYLISSTRSFRDAKDRDMVEVGEEAASVAVTPANGLPELEIRMAMAGRRSARLGGATLPRVSDLVGRLPTVCFGSDDMEIVNGQPVRRRRLLDLELSQLFPRYLEAFATYRRSLEQRNALLKAIRDEQASIKSLEPWDAKLAHAGGVIRTIRREYVGELREFACRRHGELSENLEALSLNYRCEDGGFSSEDFAEVLVDRRSRDLAAGSTTAGPHRDDVTVEIDEMSASAFGSQGQRRTAVLAIKIAQVDYWRDRMGRVPVVLLDDILSDLDASRRAQVVTLAAGFGQAIITATDLESLDRSLAKAGEVHRIEAGKVLDA